MSGSIAYAMKPSILILAASLLLTSTGPGSAEILEEGVGIVYGTDHAFSLKAPKGWVLDNESGVDQGVHAAFYPKGGTWAESTIIAYARARPKTDKIASADDAAKAVVADFHANGSPDYKARRVKTLKTDSGHEAVIYHFSGDEFGNSEAVAYFVEEKTINFVVINSRDAKVFADSLEAFEALAKSYRFMGDKPLKDGSAEPEGKPIPKKEV